MLTKTSGDKPVFSVWFKMMRMMAGLSQFDLAALAFVHPKVISRIERGRLNEVSSRQLEPVLLKLLLDCEDKIPGTGEMSIAFLNTLQKDPKGIDPNNPLRIYLRKEGLYDETT